MGFTFDDFIRLAKKAFKFWQSQQRKQQQQQQQQQQQGGQYNQNPYPQQQQQQQNAWQQPHGQQQHYQGGGAQVSHGTGGGGYGGGGYGAHDGPATVRMLPTLRDRCRVRADRGGRVIQKVLPMELMILLEETMHELEYRLRMERNVKSTEELRYHQLHQHYADYRLIKSLTFPSSLLSYPSLVYPHRYRRLSRPFSSHTPHYNDRPLPRFLLPRPPPHINLSSLEYTQWILEQQNQDMANAQNQYYVDLRNKAIKEGDLMGKAFAASKQAYSSGNGAQAHTLSEEGKQHQRMKEQYNNQAAQWIYNENNKNSPRGTYDLHGMYVAESITFADRAIAEARQSGLSEIRLIVGKGNHSPQHIAKVKPAIEELMQREKLSASLDPRNSGVLIVHLDGRQGGSGSREIIEGLEKDPGTDCVIM